MRLDALDMCVDAKLSSFVKHGDDRHNVIVKHQPLDIELNEKDFVQYAGKKGSILLCVYAMLYAQRYWLCLVRYICCSL